MEEAPGLSDQYRMASPWPMFVALGLPISEIGILFDVFPIAVGGLLLFCGSIAGMLGESGYAATPWRALAAMGGIFLLVGALFVLPELDPFAGIDLFGGMNLLTRGYAIVAAAVLMLAGALVGEFVIDESRSSV